MPTVPTVPMESSRLHILRSTGPLNVSLFFLDCYIFFFSGCHLLPTDRRSYGKYDAYGAYGVYGIFETTHIAVYWTSPSL